MEYTNINPIELGMSCMVFILYIVGKVWIHYKVEDTNDIQTKKNKRVIRRGLEWPD